MDNNNNNSSGPVVTNGGVPETNGPPTGQQKVILDQSGSSDQVRRLGEKIEKADIPEELREMLIERISRLALLRTSSGILSSNYILEYETASTYVNWIVNLPWNILTKDVLDLALAKKILDKNHYGLQSVKNRIIEYLASIILNLRTNNATNITRAPIICLVGLAGTGKTTLAFSIAESLGRHFERIPFGGMGDARTIRGQSRAMPDAEPGVIIKKLVHARSRNAVILLDEIDRVSESARSDIMGVLVELLDPEQNKGFIDHYVDYPFNLSNVLFVATANNTTNISTAVLDRLELVQMPSYSDEEKSMIAKYYLLPKVIARTGLNPQQLIIEDAMWAQIIRPLGFDSGIRSLERTIEGVCRKVARLVVEGKVTSVSITNQNVKQFLSTV
jgi:ATP-dependent Lon protease